MGGIRGTILFAALSLGLASPAVSAEPAQPIPFWSVSSDRLSFRPAQLSVPRRAGSAEYFETTEFSHKGEGVDTAIKFRSADQKIFATVYVYYPSFSHSGVQAIATDQAIRGNARSPGIRALGAGVASAGGRQGVALTADYDHYLGSNHSKAAFIKAGRWMLKVRVTGPEERSAEVANVMKGLLDGLRFDGEVKPNPAAPISAGECKAADRPDAQTVAGGGDAAIIAVSDAGGGPAAKGGKPVPARVGRDWCRTLLQVGDQKTAVLQATGKERKGRGGDAESALLVLYSDSGGVLEVVRVPKENKYLLLHHDIAEVKVLESYERLPSLAQIGRLFTEGSPTGIRARIRLNPNGAADIELPGTNAAASQAR
ncbi:MAG TPA: hypothetical protein VFR28_03990, partial [Allosphingosinicella sp.]|jgi:hypothetical protein|nr:hypothetical protein [Allosphingosinicella sp.]